MSATKDQIVQNPVQTRDDVVRLVQDLVEPLVQYMSPGKAHISIARSGVAFDDVAAELEGFARPLWGLVPLLAGGDNFKHIDIWREGMINGTDPEHKEFWGVPTAYDQRLVEFACFGFALAVAPQHFWEPLTAIQRQNLNKWLLNINHLGMPPNNWRFFKVLVNTGLRMVGGEYSQAAVEAEIQFMESFYDDKDWPNDGPRDSCDACDYYASSFAIPFYSICYSKWAQEWDPVNCEKFRRRARRQALDVAHLFDKDGANIPFGRSMTYRFAVACFFAAAAYADLELPAPLTTGVIKGIILRNIHWFTSREGIFAADGTLSIGYGYSQPNMQEQYNSAQSPYWALKPFVILALRPDHAFWTTPIEPYPEELLKQSPHAVPSMNQVFTHAAGHTMLLCSGQYGIFPGRHFPEKYCKFAYSATFGFSVPTGAVTLEQAGIDSMIAFSDDDGEHWRVRGKSANDVIQADGLVISEWKPWPDVSIKSYLFPPQGDSAYHVRAHKIVSGRSLLCAEGSFATNDRLPRSQFTRRIPPTETLDKSASYTSYSSANEALVVGKQGASGIVSLHGAGEGKVLWSDLNSNLMEPRASLPVITNRRIEPNHPVWAVDACFGLPASTFAADGDWYRYWQQKPVMPEMIAKLIKAEQKTNGVVTVNGSS